MNYSCGSYFVFTPHKLWSAISTALDLPVPHSADKTKILGWFPINSFNTQAAFADMVAARTRI